MLPEYDFRNGERPNYAERYPSGAEITVHSKSGSRLKKAEKSIIVLDDDVAKVFRDPKSVNAALRHLIAALPKERKRK